MTKNLKIWLIIILAVAVLGAAIGFLIIKFQPAPANNNASVTVDKGNEEEAREVVDDFFAQMKISARDSVYHAFNNFLSDKGWEDFIEQCETIPANRNKGQVRLLQEGRLQELWEQCAWTDQFNYEIKEVKRLDETKFEVKVLLTDLDGEIIGIAQHPEWSEGQSIIVEYKLWGEYKTDQWDFF